MSQTPAPFFIGTTRAIRICNTTTAGRWSSAAPGSECGHVMDRTGPELWMGAYGRPWTGEGGFTRTPAQACARFPSLDAQSKRTHSTWLQGTREIKVWMVCVLLAHGRTGYPGTRGSARRTSQTVSDDTSGGLCSTTCLIGCVRRHIWQAVFDDTSGRRTRCVSLPRAVHVSVSDRRWLVRSTTNSWCALTCSSKPGGRCCHGAGAVAVDRRGCSKMAAQKHMSVADCCCTCTCSKQPSRSCLTVSLYSHI